MCREGYSHASNGSPRVASGISCHGTKITLARTRTRVADRHALRVARGRVSVCRSRRVCRDTAEIAAHRRGLLGLSRGEEGAVKNDRACVEIGVVPFRKVVGTFSLLAPLRHSGVVASFKWPTLVARERFEFVTARTTKTPEQLAPSSSTHHCQVVRCRQCLQQTCPVVSTRKGCSSCPQPT